MVDSTLLSDIQQLEDAVTFYCQGKSQYFKEKRSFNFTSLTNVYNSIKLLPLDSEKIALMERFHQNIYNQIIVFHPKLYLSINFTNEINTNKPLLEQLHELKTQASELFDHYFDEKPRFDWQAMHELRAQIHKLTNTSDKTQLMRLFEHGLLAIITQIEPKVYSSLTFQSELVAAEELPILDDQSMTYTKIR